MAEGGGEGEGSHDKFRMEFNTHICPPGLIEDIQGAYGFNVMGDSGQLTIITMCHRTENCMKTWSDEVAAERAVLGEVLIAAAEEVCLELYEDSHEWSDFIDPTTARPYYGMNINFQMMETDDRYLQLGFLLHDVGCCKVIEHPDWGTNVYVTSIFTTAPHENESLWTTLKRIQNKFKI